jgi:ribosome-associated protein
MAAQALDDKKGENIALRDLQGVSEVMDYSIVVSGSSPPHLKALSAQVERVLKENGTRCYRKAGDPVSGWIVLDYIEVVIHIFETSMREYYAIEELWGEAPQIKLPRP